MVQKCPFLGMEESVTQLKRQGTLRSLAAVKVLLLNVLSFDGAVQQPST